MPGLGAACAFIETPWISDIIDTELANANNSSYLLTPLTSDIPFKKKFIDKSAIYGELPVSDAFDMALAALAIKGGKPKGAIIDTYNDHRIAMAFAMAALRAHGDIEISDCANVNTSFPGFVDQASRAGLQIEVL